MNVHVTEVAFVRCCPGELRLNATDQGAFGQPHYWLSASCGEQIRGDESGMDKSAWLARMVAVCAVTALAGGALVVASANADTRGAPALSVATPAEGRELNGTVLLALRFH